MQRFRSATRDRLASLSRVAISLVLANPRAVIIAVALATVAAGSGWHYYELDASSESLALQNHPETRYYREIRERYGSDDFVMVVYEPRDGMLRPASLAGVRRLHERLERLDAVESVKSIINVPVLPERASGLDGVPDSWPRLPEAKDQAGALENLRASPFYRNVLLSGDGRMTSLLVWLRETDGPAGSRMATREAQIASLRAVLDDFRTGASIFIGGAPMIVVDMVTFIRRDLLIFGISGAVLVIGLLGLLFRDWRCVCVSLACCLATLISVSGLAGWLRWPVTVAAANYLPLLFIFTLSLAVHLITRLRELQRQEPAPQLKDALRMMLASKLAPALLTSLTTIAAFGSMLFSDILPLITFGKLMTIGLIISFLAVFLVMPAAFALWPPRNTGAADDWMQWLLGNLARMAGGRPWLVIAAFALITAAAAIGITRLSVENSFIDNFKDDTEISRGMLQIDRHLGGTLSLDVILDPDPAYEPALPLPGADKTIADGYWFNAYRAKTLADIHNYLAGLDASGKVLSFSSSLQVLQNLNGGVPLDNFELAIAHRRMSTETRGVLFDPYLAPDGDQTRLRARVVDSSPDLDRHSLLQTLPAELVARFGLDPSQIHLTGLLVLYDAMLQSLLRSQLQSVAIVALVVSLAFLLVFSKLRVAVAALLPNIVAAVFVLGIMGWLGVPLDIMTITIAGVTIGIAVDDTIHYVHRYRSELQESGTASRAIRRTHDSVGRAILYTSLTIIAGFSLLATSNFVPTIHFGLMVSTGMAIALLADLTLLPALLGRVTRTAGEG